MTILPKKKKEQESDSDSEHSNSPSPRTHSAGNHSPGSHGSPRPSEDTAYHHSPTEGYYHRRYDLSGSSSGDSSPELPSLSKRASYRPPPSSTPVSRKKPSDASPYYSGYNSAEEYEAPRRTYFDHERERMFEQALKKERGFVIKKMRPDGACLFRAVADQVYGDQEMHTVVRNHCMDYMLKNADYFSQYVTEDFESYINRKRSDHCYGNNLEMQAIAEMYNRVIEVYQYSTEPINIFFGMYKTDNPPLRLSYHGGVHYNSVVDPYKATVGVGLGLAGYKPGHADQTLVGEALRDSENVHIEQTMLEDKMRSTDWEATCEAIEEAVARESYLSWLREQEHRNHTGKQGTTSTSAACGSSAPSYHPPLPPPMTTTSTSTGPPSSTSLPPTTHPITTANTLTTTHSNSPLNLRGSPLYISTEAKLIGPHLPLRTNSPVITRRVARNRHTPSPPTSHGHRGSPAGSHHSSLRNTPYTSPRTSPRGSLRGSPRGSAHSSPNGSPRNSLHGSPPSFPGTSTAEESHSGSHSPVARCPSPPHGSPHGSPPSGGKTLFVNGSTSPYTLDTTQDSPPHPHSPTPHQLLGAALAPSPHHSPGSHSPPHTLDFESGRVLHQLPYEYSSFLDLPPSAFGLSEWEDDRILAAVLAASQQEYIDSLKQNARGAESL